MPAPASAGSLPVQKTFQAIFADPNWTYKLGLGGMLNASVLLLFALNPLFLPLSLALLAVTFGYLLKVLQTRQPEALPEWGAYFDLFMSGMNWLTIHFLWFIIQLLWLGSCFTLAYFCLHDKSAPATILCLAILMAGFGGWFFIDFLLGFLMLNFARQEKFAAGFALATVLRQMKTQPGSYLLTWLLGIGIRWAGILLPLLTIVGVFMTPSTVFAAQVLTFALYAQLWTSPHIKAEGLSEA